ncbi:MAG: CDP-glucose 4,6-dehydratase [Methanoregulaceae archaeon]|nr:CDP-glucose 4,6-dehydratase [Methanoregulaceae archaeon]
MTGVREKLSGSYQDRTVLITGHTGFKGTWLSLWLESLGARVVGFSLDPPTRPSFFTCSGLSGRITDIRGNVLDYRHLEETVDKYRPDYIFHLAAQPLVRHSYLDPSATFATNIMGTVNILEAVRVIRHSATCVCITSDKCYENREWDYAYRENDRMGGYDPYSASKGAAEIVISSYRKSFFNSDSMGGSSCALASARAGNIIGGGDWAEDRLVPDCIRSLARGEPVKIRSPGAVRPWQYVLDPLFGYLWLATRLNKEPEVYAEAWNFGPGYANTVDVGTLCTLIIGEWGSGAWEDVSGEDPGKVHEAGTLKLDITKSGTKLGWRPQVSIGEAVRKTVAWYKQFKDTPDQCRAFSLIQIEDYMKQADSGYRDIPQIIPEFRHYDRT